MGGPGCKGGNPLRDRFLVCAGGGGGGRPDRDALNGRGVVDRCTTTGGGGAKARPLLACAKRRTSATARCARSAGVVERIGGALATKGGGSIIKGARRGSALKGANGARTGGGPRIFDKRGLALASGAGAGWGPHIFGKRGLALASGAGAGWGPHIFGKRGLALDSGALTGGARTGGGPHPLGKDGLAR